jgi:TrmH family RNA methyltransferase
MNRITSRQNAAVRARRALAAAPHPGGVRLLLDGAHLVRDALRAGLVFESAAVASTRLEGDTEEAALARTLEADGVDVIVAPDDVFSAISPARTPSGIVAVARRPASSPEAIGSSGGLVIIAVDVQDPGNLGALLRAAEAGGAAGALVCVSRTGASASPFSWKALRGSMGSALRLPVVGPLPVAIAADTVQRAGACLVAAVPRGGRDPDELSWPRHVALALGGEGPGLPPEIVAKCDAQVTIPMAPEVESLNVAVAAGILIYVARRRRRREQ